MGSYRLHYNDQINAAIQAPKDIVIGIQPTINGDSIDTEHGGGLTGEMNGDVAVLISGNVLVTNDATGNTITERAADILMHELVGHAIPQALSPNPSGNAIENDNRARGEIGLPLAPSDPNHAEKDR